MALTKQQKILNIKANANMPKSVLMELEKAMETYSPTRARQLSKIIARLESWQSAK